MTVYRTFNCSYALEILTISLMEIRPLNPVTACHPQVQETVGAILSGPPVKVGLVLYLYYMIILT